MNKINAACGVSGEYRIVINEGTPQERDTGWFKNVITNIGLEAIGTGISGHGYCIPYCRIGAGTATPAYTDVALVSQVASTNNMSSITGVSEGSPTYAFLASFGYTFTQGSVVGNMSEVGVGWAASGNTLFSRALILDGSGNPTTITLLAIDQLTVYYRLRWYPPLGDVTGNLVLSGTSYPYTMRLANANSWVGNSGVGRPGNYVGQLYIVQTHNAGSVIGPITGTPSLTNGTYGIPYAPVSVAISPYVGGSLQRTSIITLGPTQGNTVGGIGAMTLFFGPSSGYMAFQMVFSTSIPKDATKTLSFPVTMAWARH